MRNLYDRITAASLALFVDFPILMKIIIGKRSFKTIYTSMKDWLKATMYQDGLLPF